MAKTSDPRLRALLGMQGEFGAEVAARRRAAIDALARVRLASGREVARLHDALLFARAYPDDGRVLRATERALAAFVDRPDLARHREELSDSGIAGTTIGYAFYAPTLSWLVARYGSQLSVDWHALEDEERLARNLWLCLLWGESTAQDAEEGGLRARIRRLRGPRESDGEFLVRRLDALSAHAFVRERFAEELAIPFRVATGRRGPATTLARAPVRAIAYQTGPLRHARPDLAREVRRPPRSVRVLAPREGALYVALVREAMVTRSRDLDAFMHADARDVRLADCGDGLELALIGVEPERRLLLESVYGILMIQNGVPIGYSLASALFGSAEVAYNVFETFRGAEAAHVYGRVLATIHALLGADTFSVPPYQLGHDNEEGLRSGAWWFYQKLGFRARDTRTLKTVRAELARVARAPGYRTSLNTLNELASRPVFFALGRARRDVIGLLALEKIAGRISAYVARRFGADRERAQAVCCVEVARELGARTWKRWPDGERLAFERWSPLVRILPGIARWTRLENAALVATIRAKGAHPESEYVARFDRHRRLSEAVRRLARG